MFYLSISIRFGFNAGHSLEHSLGLYLVDIPVSIQRRAWATRRLSAWRLIRCMASLWANVRTFQWLLIVSQTAKVILLESLTVGHAVCHTVSPTISPNLALAAELWWGS